MNGHALAREIITIHGVDRYPTVETNTLKLVEELGELIQSVLKKKDREDQRKEYGDVGLCIYELGNKLDFDLLEAMADVVHSETRKFI